MAFKSKKGTILTLTAYRGDAKTLLAFNLAKTKARNLAGFTVQITPKGRSPFYLLNTLRFEHPENHAQDKSQSANATINSPLHKFRWVHIPGSFHQGTRPFFGDYTYTVTPRYFEQKSLLPLDPGLSVSVTIEVSPFTKGKLALGFTRGYTQSQAFVHHFGPKAIIRPRDGGLLFDTDAVAGANAAGQQYSFADEYEWLGFTAQDRIWEILDEVKGNNALRLDVFAYDLNEPDFIKALLKLAKAGRVRIILDDAALHHSASNPKPEDEFEAEFRKVAKGEAVIMRGNFDSYAHDKVLIVRNGNAARKVLTGSTNFSVTGLYVNSNHVLIYDDPAVAQSYLEVFNQVLTQKASAAKFRVSALSTQPASFASSKVPATDINHSPHTPGDAKKVLGRVVTRIAAEGKAARGNVLFAVMALKGGGAVYPTLKKLHANEAIFSYGISDGTDGVVLYQPKSKRGVLVGGKPGKSMLPPPFDQVPGVGLGHQVHHKFVVCGFNGPDPVVFCGSSNLAQGGEEKNGDNLLEIHDGDVATAFAIEAVTLVDHFSFLSRETVKAGKPPTAKPAADKAAAAVKAGWFLGVTDKWTEPYFDDDDLRSVDRQLFG